MPGPAAPVFIPDICDAIQIPEKGIASRILQNDERSKIVLYALTAGHEMGLHAAPRPATLYFVEGEAQLTLGDETMTVGPGAFTHMPPHCKHAIVARTGVIMLLTIIAA